MGVSRAVEAAEEQVCGWPRGRSPPWNALHTQLWGAQHVEWVWLVAGVAVGGEERSCGSVQEPGPCSLD